MRSETRNSLADMALGMMFGAMVAVPIVYSLESTVPDECAEPEQRVGTAQLSELKP